MGAKISVLGLIMYFSPYLRSAMVRFPLCHHRPILGICSFTRGLHDLRKWIFFAMEQSNKQTDMKTLTNKPYMIISYLQMDWCVYNLRYSYCPILKWSSMAAVARTGRLGIFQIYISINLMGQHLFPSTRDSIGLGYFGIEEFSHGLLFNLDM